MQKDIKTFFEKEHYTFLNGMKITDIRHEKEDEKYDVYRIDLQDRKDETYTDYQYVILFKNPNDQVQYDKGFEFKDLWWEWAGPYSFTKTGKGITKYY